MRRIAIIALLLLVPTIAVMSMPLVALMELRSALVRSDVETLRDYVDWVRVRESLKVSVEGLQSSPFPSIAKDGEGEAAPPRGWWQRTREAARPAIGKRLIERYVTPEGAPRLFSLRHTWRERVAPTIGLGRLTTALDGTPLAGTAIDRMVTFLRQVERMSFTWHDRFEMDVRDRLLTDRRLGLALERQGLRWRLVEVFLLAEPEAAARKSMAQSYR